MPARTVRITLHRQVRPKKKGGKTRQARLAVRVGRITVRGFREATRIALARVLAFSATLPGKPTPEQALACLGDEATVTALADLICVGQPRRFFSRWFSQQNAVRIMRASRDAEGDGGWQRMLDLIDWTGEKVKRGGGLVSDIAALCRIYPNLTPLDILDMAMQDFLDLCDCITAAGKAAQEAAFLEDPTMDPDAKPTPLRPGMMGGGKAWVH